MNAQSLLTALAAEPSTGSAAPLSKTLRSAFAFALPGADGAPAAGDITPIPPENDATAALLQLIDNLIARLSGGQPDLGLEDMAELASAIAQGLADVDTEPAMLVPGILELTDATAKTDGQTDILTPDSSDISLAFQEMLGFLKSVLGHSDLFGSEIAGTTTASVDSSGIAGQHPAMTAIPVLPPSSVVMSVPNAGKSGAWKTGDGVTNPNQGLPLDPVNIAQTVGTQSGRRLMPATGLSDLTPAQVVDSANTGVVNGLTGSTHDRSTAPIAGTASPTPQTQPAVSIVQFQNAVPANSTAVQSSRAAVAGPAASFDLAGSVDAGRSAASFDLAGSVDAGRSAAAGAASMLSRLASAKSDPPPGISATALVRQIAMAASAVGQKPQSQTVQDPAVWAPQPIIAASDIARILPGLADIPPTSVVASGSEAPGPSRQPDSAPRLASALIGQIKIADPGEGVTRIMLSPRGLGSLEIELAVTEEGGVSVVVRAENSQVLQALRDERALLAQSMGMADGSALEFEDYQQPGTTSENGQDGQDTGSTVLTDGESDQPEPESTHNAGQIGSGNLDLLA